MENYLVARAKECENSSRSSLLLAASKFREAASSFKLGKFWEDAAVAYKRMAYCYLEDNSRREAAAGYADAAFCFENINMRDAAASMHAKAADCYLEADDKVEAAEAYLNAAYCYKLADIQESMPFLQKSLNLLLETEELPVSTEFSKRVAELYEQEQEFFKNETGNIAEVAFRHNMAKLLSGLGQYENAIEIYECIAQELLGDNHLEHDVQEIDSALSGHNILFEACICHLDKDDGAMESALEKYQELDPSFSQTLEHRLFTDLVAVIDEEDVGQVADVVERYASENPNLEDKWKIDLLKSLRCFHLE